MKNLLTLLGVVCLATTTHSQIIEFGPSISYHRTAFQHPDNSVVVTDGGAGNGLKTTETDQNIAFGGYFGYYTENTFAYTAEIFYVKTSTPNYATEAYQSINFIPSVAVELGNSNLFVNIGPGVGVLLNEPNFSEVPDVEGENYQSIDFLAKGALNLRMRDIMTIDGGVLYGLTDIVDDQNRMHFFIGVRFPLSRWIGLGM